MTSYQKTLFRFPLRSATSALSENIYNTQKLQKLTDALREEAKSLLLFLRSVDKIEVYNISQGGFHTLSFRVQIASENQGEVGQKRTTFLAQLRRAHESQPYGITGMISFTTKFEIEVTDNNCHNNQSGSSVWLVTNCIGSRESTVIAAAIKQHVFPWVGTSLELPKTQEAPIPPGGRIYCFLPLPIEASSNLPVNVNGTFSLNDERRTLKWPGRERMNDPMAEWNKLLATELLPPCYAMLLDEAMKYLQPDQFYNAWPDVRSVRGSEWEGVVRPLLNIIFSKECFWSSTIKQWVHYSYATFIPESTTLLQVVKRVLTACGVKLVDIPQKVWNAIDYQSLRKKVNLVTANLARREIRPNTASYADESHDSKLDLLTYCLSDQNFLDLLGLHLLPLSNGTFVAFQKPRRATTLHLCSHDYPCSLLPNISHLLVDINNKALQSKLDKVATSGKTQLQTLSVQTVAKLLPSCCPPEWTWSQTVSLPSPSFPSDWFQTFWNWVKKHNLSYFANQLVVPLAIRDTRYGFKVTKLVRSSSSAVVYISEDCSPHLLSALTKLQVQCTIYKHVDYLWHRQLSSFLNMLNPSGVMTAIANANEYIHTSFSSSEASELQRFLALYIHNYSLNTAQHKVLKNLKLFTSVNKQGLYSAVQASNGSWGNRAIKEPHGHSIPTSSLPSNLVVLSGDNQATILQQCNPLVAMPNTLLNFVLDIIFPMIKRGSFPEEQLDSFMEQVLQLFPVLKQQDPSKSYFNATGNFVTELSNLSFLNSSSSKWASRTPPKSLYDPLNVEVRNLYEGESVFPIEPFNQEKHVYYLRQCGLRGSVTAKELCDILISVSTKQSLEPQKINSTQMTRVKAVLSYISNHHSVLQETLRLSGRNWTFSQALQIISKQKCCFPVLPNSPKNYPLCLTWKGAGYTSHVVSNNNSVLFQKGDGIDALPLITGSQMYTVAIPSNLHPLFTSEVPIDHVLAHFKLIIQQSKHIEIASLDALVHRMYTFMSSNIKRLASMRVPTFDLQSQDCQWIWLKNPQQLFVSSGAVVIQNHTSFAYSLNPYLYQLPYELQKYSRLFISLGVHKQLADSQIIAVLKSIKEDTSDTVPAEQAWRMVEHILNWLTDGGDTLASIRLKTNEQLYVPIESTSERPQLVEVEKVVYTDLDFLKAFHFSAEETITFIHHKVAHLAKSLRVTPLSAHLNIAEDAFGDVGQHEPLVTRLKNILRDYKDGLTIIKELLQNADDAEATELNICYDARTHETDPQQLLFSGMTKCHGPALVVHNNAVFTDEDFQNITKLAGATKQNKPLKIGKFGVGFCSVYHITDVPSFVSKDWLYIFDPTLAYLKEEIRDQARPGKRLRFTEALVSHSKQLQPYLKLFGFQQDKPYQGTLFRFPFRTSTSDISGLRYDSSHVDQLVSDIKEAGSKLLLFLKNVKRITVSQIHNGDSETTLLLDIKKSDGSTVISENPSSNDSCSAMIKQVSITSSFASHRSSFTRARQVESWLVSSHGTLLATYNSSKYATASIACVLKESSAVDVIDSPSFYPEKVTGELFCFLPLALETGLPVHVSSNFAVLNDRSGIHSSDAYQIIRQSEEVQWNMKLMKVVIPKAYHTLLLALQEMYKQGTVPVDEYTFHLLWPLKESLTTHHPWDYFLPVLYRLISESRLFYSACTEKWLPLKECKILSTDILCYRGSREPSTPQCVTEVAEGLRYPLIYFPSSVKIQFPEYDITHCILNEEEFLMIFFSNMNSVSIATRNNVLFLLLEAYAVTPKPYMTKFMKANNCIPCTPNGIQLRKCSEVVDPCREVSQLFHPDDERFPTDTFHNSRLIHVTLAQLGMMCDTLPWDMLIDRALIIAKLHSIDCELAMKRAALVIKCIDSKLLQLQDSFDSPNSTPYLSEYKTSLPAEAFQLTSIAFLPVTQKPKSYPARLNWGGKNRKLLSSHALMTYDKSTFLVGSQVSIVCEANPEEGGCHHIPPRVCTALGIKTEANCKDVVNHLCHIIDTYCLITPDEQEKEWIEKTYEAICIFFEEQFFWKAITEQDLKKLTTLPSIWTGTEFIDPKYVACNWTNDGPYLYGLPYLLKAKNNLIKAIRIQEKFSIEQMLHALKYMHDKFKGSPLDEKEMKFIPELALELQNQLGDSELEDHQTCYLPNEDCVMQDTSQLAYNDAQWCSIVQDCHFVHSSITRQAAVKLRVKLMRAKALEKYESTTHDYNGVPFGQREELTQRIKNILSDYPCDITVIKELLQNADDAKATKMYIILDERSHGTDKLPSSEWKDLQGPALLVWNDKEFSEADFKGIQKLGLGSKRSNWESIGQFGIGFNVVYHLTDCPSFITNGNILCVLDPHCRYVPGADRFMPGRQYNNLDAQFWKNCSDLKSPYLQEEVEGCPKEVAEGGTLFRFPLRHSRALVDQSELIQNEYGSTNTLLSAWKMKKHLNEWAPKMKESLTFLNHVTELKFFVISDQSRMIVTHHFKVNLNDSAFANRKLVQEKARLFTETRREPYVVTYPLSLCEEVPQKVVENFLIQQGVGDIQNPDQHWEYLSRLKPKHGIAARTDDVRGLMKGRVFCFLPLPLESCLPVHVNGNFILDAARSGLWQSRDTHEVDDRKKWNLRLIEAIASSYVNFLVECRDIFVSPQPYEIQDQMWNAIRCYYSIFPNLEGRDTPEAEMKLLAKLVYKGLHKQNSKVLVAFNKIKNHKPTPTSTEGVLANKIHKSSYKIEWLQLFAESEPSKQAYFWEKPSTEVFSDSDGSPSLKTIPSILKSIGMQLTAAPMKLKRNFSCVDVKLPQALPPFVYKYYSAFHMQISPDGTFPCYLKDTSFGSVESFLNFTLYIIEPTSSDNEFGTHYKFPDPGPFGLPLLLTADEQLRMFTEDDKVIRTSFSNLFLKMKKQFLHLSMLQVKYVKSYFLEPDEKNWPLIQKILEETLPRSLQNERLHHADQYIDIERMLMPFWLCLLSESIFPIHLKNILNEWAILLTKEGELFACKSTDQLLPSIAPLKPKKDLLSEESSQSDLPTFSMWSLSETTSSLLEVEVYEIMERCNMPILDITVCRPSLCSWYCPQFSQPDRILSNLYYLYKNGQLTAVGIIKSKIDILFEYFGRIHFAQDNDSLLKIKALPLFRTIEYNYCALTNETYILPKNVCLAGSDIWIQDTGTVILSSDGEWRKLGPASVLRIKEVSALFAYTRLIFPHFHLLNDEHRILQLKYIRDTPELFDLALKVSQLNADSEQKEESVERKEESMNFISSLEQLRCIDNNGILRPVSEFCDPTKPIFKIFPVKIASLPATFVTKDDKWLEFFCQIGLKSKLTKEEFIEFCHTVSKGNHQNLQSASNVLLNYLFKEKDWREDHHFLNRVAAIPFVFAEPLKELSWIKPVFGAEITIQQGDKTVHLTKLKGAANYKHCNFVWTVMPVVKLPECYQYHFQDEIEKFHRILGICTIPPASKVVQNILNIAKTRFANFCLFEEYSEDCRPNFKTRGEEFLFGVLADNFYCLSRRDCQCSKHELALLEKTPCIPVSNTGRTDKVVCPVLVQPIQVVASDVKQLVPFINPLPDKLYSYHPELLAKIGVKSEIQLCHVTNALEAIQKHIEPPFDPNTIKTVKGLLKTLYDLFKNASNGSSLEGTLYLPSKNKLIPSSLLLYDDTGRYKEVKFNFSQVDYSMVSLLTDKFEELSEFGFQLNDFCAVLPQNVRPLPFSASCIDKLHESCIPHERHSQFVQQLQMAFEQSEFGKCAQMILGHTSTNTDISRKFAESLEIFRKSLKVVTVSNLTVDIFLDVVNPPCKIGTAKVRFSLQKEVNGFCLYVDENVHPGFYNLFEALTSTITECVAGMAGINKNSLNNPEQALKIMLQAPSADELAYILYDLGINTTQLKLTDSINVELAPKLGSPIPEQWIHRLKSSINSVFKPQEWVGFEIRDDYFVFAQVLYQIIPETQMIMTHDQDEDLEVDDTVELPCFRIRTQEDDEEGTVVSIIDLHKILRIRQVKSDHESTEIILYVPESEGVHLWDAVKDVTLKNVMRQICDELRRIQKIKDKDQRRKALKAIYLKYHPDRNNTIFAEKAFQFLQQQIIRLEQDLHLEDPNQTEVVTQSSQQFQESLLYYNTFECSSQGREVKVDEHDVTLNIPAGAISDGERVQFQVGVCLYGPFNFPEGKRPISPIIWLCTKSDVELKQPIEVILPHVLTGLSEKECGQLGFCFAKANHNENCNATSSERKVYDFHPSDTKAHVFSTESKSFGIWKTSHCCYICILAENNRETALSAGFCLSRVEYSEEHNNSIDFCATFCLQTCINVS